MNPLDFIMSVISRCILWLQSWQLFGVPFLYWMIGYSIVAITMRYIF